MDSLLVERADGVVTCTLNRPEKKNALTGEMWLGLTALFDEVAENPDDRVLVITGAGDGFCSGADLGNSGNDSRRGPAAALAVCESWAGPRCDCTSWPSRRLRR
jgi:2-(1,2-epoxy-1,2-dihydrophenyl)acetyl-CoA isomerase